MKRDSGCLIILMLLIFQSFAHAQSIDLTLGEKITFQSNVLNEERVVYVALPENYSRSEKAFPVMYLLDADVNFPFTAGIIQYLANYNLISSVIVVGITNQNTATRNRDFTPNSYKSAPERFSTAGGADRFLQFIEEELIPHIEQKYRTQPFRILHGHSLGGLFAFHAFQSKPALFHAYFAISPSLWWNNMEMIDKTKQYVKNHPDTKGYFFFSIADEGEEALPSLKELNQVMIQSASESFRVTFKHFPNENHASTAIAATLFALQDLYDGWSMDYQTMLGGMKSILEYQNKMSDRFNYEIPLTERALHSAGCSVLVGGHVETAIELLQFNAERYPDAPQTYAILAEAFLEKGDIEIAIQYCKKTLAIDPQYKKAKRMLEKLLK